MNHSVTSSQISRYGEWGGYKQRTRQETIIDPFLDIFGMHSIPTDQQYVSLGGQCSFTDSGLPNPESDVGQMLSSGFATASQIHSIDFNELIIRGNIIAYPQVNWYNGELCDVIRNMDFFNPGVINFDSVNTPPKAIALMIDLMKMTSHITNIMLVVNMVSKVRHVTRSHYTLDDISDLLEQNSRFQTHRRLGNWILYPLGCEYRSFAKTTQMTTIILYKHENNNDR